MVLDILEIISVSVLMVIVPVYGQWNLYDIIDDSKFKRIKIKKFAFLFKAISFQSVKKHGIILPLFVIQLISYPLAVFSIIFGLIGYISESPKIVSLLVILGIETFVYVLLTITLSVISKKRKNSSVSD